MTPQERAEALYLNHGITLPVGYKHENPAEAVRLIIEAIDAAVKEERKACAEIADAHKIRTDHQNEENDWGRNEAAVEIADAIRRRGQS